MKTSNRTYPLAPRRWMPPSPSLSRLHHALKMHGCPLNFEDLGTLHDALLLSIEAGTTEAATLTVDTLRRALTLHGKRLSRKKLGEVLACYLGGLPWETRLEQMAQEPSPVSLGKHPPIHWWREHVETWARFVYQVTGKLEGSVFFPKGGGHDSEVGRVRVLTQCTTASPAVIRWKQQFLKAHPDQLAPIAYSRENAYIGTEARALESTPAPRILTHYLIVEAKLTSALDHMEGEPLMQSKLRKLHESGLWREVLGSNSRHFALNLIPISEDVLPGWVDCQKAPGFGLNPWPLKSRGWATLAETQGDFHSIMDFSKTSGEWDKATGRKTANFTCERFGIVQMASNVVTTGLKSILGKAKWSAHWSDIAQTSPFHEAVHSPDNGLLLSRASGEVVRYAPWNGGQRHFMLDINFSEKANALTLELAAQAHADGKVVLVYGDTDMWSPLMEELTPGKVVHLKEATPLSLNPFSGVRSEEELQKLLPAFVNITYDLLGMTQNLASEALNRHFVTAWKLHGEDLELKHIANQFRVYGKPDERALQSAIDHFVDIAGPWVSGRAADCLKNGITCVNAARLTSTYEARYVLGPIVSHLVVALAYRNAVAADQGWRNGSLSLVCAEYLEGSRNRAELLMSHFARVNGSIGLHRRGTRLSESGLLQAFRHERFSIPRIHLDLTQNSPGLHLEALNKRAIQALPCSTEDRAGKLSFVVLHGDETLDSFTMERPLGKS